MKKVVVASLNPVKIRATRSAFRKVFPNTEFSFKGASVPSGVSDQPMSKDETIRGATNRAKRIKNKYSADYWVGIEGGVEFRGKDLDAYAWMVILSKDMVGIGRTGSFTLPRQISKLIRNGMELGHADDVVFGKTNSKQKTGSVGLLTGNLITRTTYYRDALILALIPFKNKKYY